MPLFVVFLSVGSSDGSLPALLFLPFFLLNLVVCPVCPLPFGFFFGIHYLGIY
jgi:hypothetical protein